MNEILRAAALRAKFTPAQKVPAPVMIPKKMSESELIIQSLQYRIRVLEESVGKIVNELGVKVSDDLPTFPPIKRIIAATARYFEIPIPDLVGHARSKGFLVPRQVAMYLARHLTPHGFPAIALKFNDRDHTTVMHAVRKIEARRKADASLDKAIAYLSRELVKLEHGVSSQATPSEAAAIAPRPSPAAASPFSGAA